MRPPFEVRDLDNTIVVTFIGDIAVGKKSIPLLGQIGRLEDE
jgi:hypothetical protein